ncbi:MAG: Hsp20/alpha crystallin family protein [Vicinamibacterales bacterium]
MSGRKEVSVIPTRFSRDPFGLLRQMTSEFDRAFDEPFWSSFRWPFRGFTAPREVAWSPGIDVFEKDNRLITKIDLPGMKKEDVKVEVTDGYLTISGERKSEAEEKKENYYRCERDFGSFYRTVPLPENVKFDDVKATFADGVLEVSVPLPVKAEAKPRSVVIEEHTAKAAKAA